MNDLKAAPPTIPFARYLSPDLLQLVARLFLAMPFVVFGTMKYINMDKMRAYIEHGGLPGGIIWLVIPYQILCGLSVATGFFTRVGAFLLGGFCIVATVLYHNEWGRSGELSSFTKDFAQAGGFVYLWIYGPGRYSLDRRFGRF